MFKPAADAWALEVAHQVVSHAPFETTHIELKAQVPDPKKFARQFAGLANAARSHPVLLLFGLDRKDGVVGVNTFEVGDWYQSLRALFEYGEAPTLAYQNFFVLQDKQIAAFVFDTDSPPYVVTESRQGGEREVPWRYGANTGVAGRRELLSLLLRRSADPEVEFTKAELRLAPDGVIWAHAELFIYPAPSSDEMAIPIHRVMVHVTDAQGAVGALDRHLSFGPVSGSSRAKCVDSTLLVPGVSKLQLTARSNSPSTIAHDTPDIQLVIAIHPARAPAPIRFSTTVAQREHPDCQRYWELPEHHSLRLHTTADTLREIEEKAQRFGRNRRPSPFGMFPPPPGWD